MAPEPQPLSFSSVPQASLTHFPESHQKELVQAFDVPADRISTCTVTHETYKLYNTILLYAALCPNTLDPNAARRFFINQTDPYAGPLDDEGLLHHFRRNMFISMRFRSIASGSGTRRPTAPRPKLRMDVGSTVICWPPPEHLVPQFLISNGVDKPYKLPEGMGESIILHIMHYEMGAPLSTHRAGVTPLHVVRVSTHHGDEALQHFLNDILQWSYDRSSPDHQGRKYNLYRFTVDQQSGQGDWDEEGARHARPHDSVVLADGQMEAIIEDMEQFLHPDSKSWYIEHGLPHRRSYLFEGVPGTGKTSTIRVLAGKYSLSCCFLSMTSEKFSNQQLNDALSGVPSNALLVLEDVDALFKEDRSSTNSSSLTFSGLLNALDGVTSTEGLITIMTTNHADRLDPALIRGGRVDRRFRFAPPSEKQLGILLKLFYKNVSEEMAKQFIEIIVGWGESHEAPTIATLQQLFIRYRGSSVETCVAALPEFLSESAAYAAAVKELKEKRTAMKDKGGDGSKENALPSVPRTAGSGKC